MKRRWRMLVRVGAGEASALRAGMLMWNTRTGEVLRITRVRRTRVRMAMRYRY